ncbi:MAG: Tritrans,polycis-undecaprenyl-diphosphate synthase (GGDP specific) [Methanoregulaceae archaeon PtaB.Bin108]|nr:MAG: Tritrans,polycis-undecaprenyl-diphosphate synthase (GGDP specific) [Methanoregulaceae archaeon PtaB.Bin108]
MIREIASPLYERFVRLQCHHIPAHIAIIQDGNRRFARLQNLPRSMGHRAGAARTEEMLDWARELGIRYITLYSFSTENFQRDPDEVGDLFELFKEKFKKVTDDPRVHKDGIRVRIVGDRKLLPDDLRRVIEKAEESTEKYSGYHLNIALAYGGRNEIVQAAARILEGVRSGTIKPDDITPEIVEEHLHSGMHLPPVDLIIRTGNEWRTSNFLPWLASGHESAVYFCAPYWPLFRKIDLLRAIRVYSQRIDSRISRDAAGT